MLRADREGDGEAEEAVAELQVRDDRAWTRVLEVAVVGSDRILNVLETWSQQYVLTSK